MKKYIIGIILISVIFTQSEQPYPPLELVSIPTAGTLPRGTYTYETILSKGGTLMPRLAIGLTSSLSLGLSWGMNNIIGDEKPEINIQPGFYVKYRAFDESDTRPAFLLGINTQGKGKYTDYTKAERDKIGDPGPAVNRYEHKALGLFISLTINQNNQYSNIVYAPYILYEYSIDDIKYFSDKYTLSSIRYGNPHSAKKIVDI